MIESLLGTIQNKDPQLYGAIIQLTKDLYDLYNQVNPPVASSLLNDGSSVPTTETTDQLEIFVYPNNIRLKWEDVPDFEVHEIRLGTVWDTAQILLTTTSFTADFDPIILGIQTGVDYTFQIAHRDSSGNYGPRSTYTINIPVITAPVITPTVLSNNVLLNWTIPTSTFTIARYNVYRNGVLYATISGTFLAIFEITGGVFSYIIQAVDIVGNIGAPSAASSVTLTAPIDYIQRAIQTSTFSGTKNNCGLDLITSRLIACIDTAEIYATHFSSRGWATPQDQVNAGYPLYIEPSIATGYYEEVFDFGSIFTNVIVSTDWNFDAIVGSVSIAVTISVSNDNISYDSPLTGTTRLATSLRYAKVRLTFTPTPATTSLISLFNFRTAIAVHREQDGGTATCLASDVAGTVVSFNKAFKAVDSITLTPLSTTIQTAIFDFAFPANPTSFKILLYDGSGVRIDGTVAWDARGIL